MKFLVRCSYTERTVLVTALLQASYLRKKELVALDSGKRTTVGSGGFF
ncbi:hypothetical protein ZJ83_004660, partial [Salmonella enterica subsp. enterica serovar Mbandaka]|nr:hypothetical protein [Salmonella enterica subsp. enterica serovar Braenderup]EDR0185912.1 hypothetical protein [Salmonella enterica subsp. enterica serovar Mbandaka]EDR2133683.1 hypothetical protein [Salmonella enterica]EDS3863376.1 hypothetical protein [Salmonella enterica subsp. enterica serovar Ohio]EDW7944893.1 hypothetical protein [Salmonella enterica subsp. enterica serovar Ruiru]EDX8324368.1 hypothetical protein [Salmonella enterica subsp. enterica]EDY0529057.1 hypothetical protein 